MYLHTYHIKYFPSALQSYRSSGVFRVIRVTVAFALPFGWPTALLKPLEKS